MSERHDRLAQARLYLVCDERPDAFLAAALAGGVDVVQLRMKHAEDAAVRAVATRFAHVCAAHGALFILNDRPDLAALVDADGAHVGQDDLACAHARRLLGADRLLGLSTHSPAQIDAAAEAGVDYIGVGPVHATPTKPGRPSVGLELVAEAARTATVPWFAIGGIDATNVADVAAAGARRIAVVRAITDAGDPQAAAAALRSALASHEGTRAAA